MTDSDLQHLRVLIANEKRFSTQSWV